MIVCLPKFMAIHPIAVKASHISTADVNLVVALDEKLGDSSSGEHFIAIHPIVVDSLFFFLYYLISFVCIYCFVCSC